MPLTTVRLPVADIAAISNGTTDITIAASGGDIDVDVAGANVIDIAETSITIDDLVTLVANTITGESFLPQTGSGAQGQVESSATELTVGTTSAHTVDLISNNVPTMTLETDNKVTLAVVGTAGDQLVDKDYVDTEAAAQGGQDTATTSGQIIIPGSTENIIIKWGVKSGTGTRTITFADDTAAFPNAIFTVVATPQNTGSANSDGWNGVQTLATTGFVWNSANRGSYAGDVNWIAIGY